MSEGEGGEGVEGVREGEERDDGRWEVGVGVEWVREGRGVGCMGVWVMGAGVRVLGVGCWVLGPHGTWRTSCGNAEKARETADVVAVVGRALERARRPTVAAANMVTVAIFTAAAEGRER